MRSRAGGALALCELLRRSPQTCVASVAPARHPQASSGVKRALGRAVRRAEANPHGLTWYRGKLHSVSTLRHIIQPSVSDRPPRVKPRHPPPTRHGPRLSVVTWNVVGGLSHDAWVEVQVWLHTQCAHDIVLLQETHWQFSNLFPLPKYHVVHSGTTDHRHQGCAVLVRRELVDEPDVRWSSILAGHVLHVRFPFKGRHVDVINTYQYAWHSGSDREQLLHKRERVWIRLDQLISTIPIRNTLLLGGDFNCVGTFDGHRFGPSTARSQSPHPDKDSLANLARVHCLTALNTWGHRTHMSTFQHESACSQIDFLLMRRAQSDGLAKQARPDHAFHVLRWRGGALHRPVQASIPALHYQQAGHAPKPLPPSPKYLVEQAPEALSAFREELATLLASGPVSPESLNHALRSAGRHLDTPDPPTTTTTPQQVLEGAVLSMWQARRRALQYSEVWGHRSLSLRAGTDASHAVLRTAMRGWLLWARYLGSHSAIRKRSRGVKREIFQDCLEKAVHAEQLGDQRALYAVIRRLAPRTTRSAPRGTWMSPLTPAPPCDSPSAAPPAPPPAPARGLAGLPARSGNGQGCASTPCQHTALEVWPGCCASPCAQSVSPHLGGRSFSAPVGGRLDRLARQAKQAQRPAGQYETNFHY